MSKIFDNIEIHGTGDTSNSNSLIIYDSDNNLTFGVRGDGITTAYGSLEVGGGNANGQPFSMSTGRFAQTISPYAFSIGSYASANGSHCIALMNATTVGYESFAAGNCTANGTHSFAFGNGITVTGRGSIGFGMNDISGTEMLTQDYTTAFMGGVVGIGTVTPSAKLHVVGTGIGTEKAIKVDNSGSTELFSVYDSGQVSAGDGNQGLFMGQGAGVNIAGALYSTSFGYNTLNALTTGNYNTMFGYNAGAAIQDGSRCVAMGFAALSSNISGFGATAIGWGAGSVSTSGQITAVGYGSLQSITSGKATAIGFDAFNSLVGGGNSTAVGFQAGEQETSGDGNSYFGSNSGRRKQGANNNSFIGFSTGEFNKDGSNNVFIGASTGYFNNDTGDGNGTIGGNNNTFIGAKVGISYTGSNSVLIGYQTAANTLKGTNMLAIDNGDNAIPLIYGDFTSRNLGLGLINPLNKLSVDGDIEITSNSNFLKFKNVSILGVSQSAGATNIMLGRNASGTDSGNGGFIAIGDGATSTDNSISIGSLSNTIDSIDSIAIGRGSTVASTAVRGIAIGRNANASFGNSFALGFNTTTTAPNQFLYGDSSVFHGFGTNNPTDKLHISGGTLRINNGNEGDGKLAVSDANGSISFSSTTNLNIPTVVAYADLTGQTTEISNITSYTASTVGTYRVGGYLNVTAVVTDVIQLQITYTDENGTPQTEIFVSNAIATSISTVSNNPMFAMDIRVSSGSAITIKTVLTTGIGSITYDVGGNITKLY